MVPGVVENLVDVAILELAYGVFTATYLEVKHFINRLPRYFGKTYITSVWSLFKRSPDQVLSLINTKFLSCSRVQIMFLVYNNYYALLCETLKLLIIVFVLTTGLPPVLAPMGANTW